MTRKKASLCVECIKFDHGRASYGPCSELHKPRFYLPANGNPHDPRAGWRRVCDDFERKEESK